jgi:iron complex outermembrane receptor protein
VQSATTVRAAQLHRGSVRIGWLLLLVFLLLLLISVPVRSDESPGNSAVGQPTLEETLNRMPQIGRTGNNPSLGSNPGIGGADVDLRGMGPTRTLVLLNGRRVAPSGTDNRVDLNTIPQQLVDRIEIITGGTSAV